MKAKAKANRPKPTRRAAAPKKRNLPPAQPRGAAVAATAVPDPPLTGVRKSQVGVEVQSFINSDVENLAVAAEGQGKFTITPLDGANTVNRGFALAARRGGARGAAAGSMLGLAEIKTCTPTDQSTATPMDPRLQLAATFARLGIRSFATASASANELSVVARVTEPLAWSDLPDVRPGAVLGRTDDGWIVTGRIPANKIEAIRGSPVIKSLKAAQPLKPSLAASIEETRARKDLLPTGQKAAGGKGVVIGIVDFGCDFVHDNFRKSNGKTRLLGIWDQSGTTTATSPFGYGRRHTPAAIDAALKSPQPYVKLQYTPDAGSHGTHVADIAAGNGRGTGTPGMAPSADILFVEVAAADIPWSGLGAVGKSFGDSVQLLEAVRFIFDQAGTRPCVVNLSLGTNGGPHDGSTLVEQGIDAMLREKPNRAVTIAASNSQEDGIHASGQVPNGGQFDLEWQTFPTDQTGNEIEVWYRGVDRFAVELVAPDGTILTRVEPGQSRSLAHPSSPNQPLVFLANRINDPNNHDNTVGLFLAPNLPPGRWQLRLHGLSVTQGDFHAWIERDDSGQFNQNQASFTTARADTHTIGSISCGNETLVVGSYDAHKSTTPISSFSSAGPTRDRRNKPEISAPGHNVLAANAGSGNGARRMSGTSMASPAVAGIAALVLAHAKKKGKSLSSAELRSILTSTARPVPPAGPGWNDRFGNGRIDARAAVAKV